MLLNEIANKFPLISLSPVYHTGTLDASKKKAHSHEGPGLSITSADAVNSWVKLARASGQLWELSKKNDSFIDYHRLSENQLATVLNWGVTQKLIKKQDEFTVTYYDEEMDDEMIMSFDNREDAEAEAEGYETEVVTKEGYSPTALANKRAGFKIDLALLKDILVTFYAEDVLKIDGVWWQDTHDVSRYSAPRGVIVPSMIKSWNAQTI